MTLMYASLIGFTVLSLFLLWKVNKLSQLIQFNDNTIETQSQVIDDLATQLGAKDHIIEDQKKNLLMP